MKRREFLRNSAVAVGALAVPLSVQGMTKWPPTPKTCDELVTAINGLFTQLYSSDDYNVLSGHIDHVTYAKGVMHPLKDKRKAEEALIKSMWAVATQHYHQGYRKVAWRRLPQLLTDTETYDPADRTELMMRLSFV